MKYPIKGDSYVTQKYGSTRFAQSSLGSRLYKNFGGIHPGYDFGTKGINLPCISMVEGRVVKAKWDGGWGYHIEIMAKDGWRRQYAHLSSMNVVVNDLVYPGDEVGKVGNTGASTATHLHYGHRKWGIGGWKYRDPSIDFEEQLEETKLPDARLIMSSDLKDKSVYVFNGINKFPIPDWDTFILLFTDKGSEEIVKVDPAVLSKIPQGEIIPSMTKQYVERRV